MLNKFQEVEYETFTNSSVEKLKQKPYYVSEMEQCVKEKRTLLRGCCLVKAILGFRNQVGVRAQGTLVL